MHVAALPIKEMHPLQSVKSIIPEKALQMKPRILNSLQTRGSRKNNSCPANVHAPSRSSALNTLSLPPTTCSSPRIRARYYQSIGIEIPVTNGSSPRTHVKLLSDSGSVPVTVVMPLKTDCDRLTEMPVTLTFDSKPLPPDLIPAGSSTASSSLSSLPSIHNSRPRGKNHHRSVTFDTFVSVHPIPTRGEYSKRVSRRLWNDRAKTSLNAARNAIEFASENLDWRQAVEDSDFVVDFETGERIHPVHYARYLHRQAAPVRRQKDCFLQLSKMAAMQWQQ